MEFNVCAQMERPAKVVLADLIAFSQTWDGGIVFGKDIQRVVYHFDDFLAVTVVLRLRVERGDIGGDAE